MPSRPAAAIVLAVACLLLGAGCDDDDATSDDAATVDDPIETTTVEEEELEEGDVDSRDVELAQVDGSGISGTVEVGPGESEDLQVEVELDGDVSATHGVEARAGSCDDAIDPGAIDELAETVSTFTLPDVEDGRMQTEVSLPDDVVGTGSYALVVYDGADLDGDVAACAQVEVE